jgi:POT family proton-dependent oligopeptide transporter
VKELSPEQTRSRITALMLVFAVVIFFWMAFHQNGSTMTYFARDYTTPEATGITRMGFDIFNLLLMAIGVYALFGLFQSQSGKGKTLCGVVVAAVIGGLYYKYTQTPAVVRIEPQLFQQFNPFFVVALTPFSMALFGYLARKQKEPSAPRKIGMGMLVAACGFLILAIGSMGLISPVELKAAGASNMLVSQNWLISTYLVLTFAELLLSPMGISFVSKVAPPKYKGAMMGCWFAATAIGNYATALIGYLWGSSMPLWAVWGVLIVCCLLSAAFIFSIMRKLERATADA